MSGSLVHLTTWRHDQRCFSEVHIWLLCGLLSSQFDCSAYDRIVVCMLYILVVIFHSQDLLEAVCKCSFFCICQGLFPFLQVRVKIYMKISLDFKEQSFFTCLYHGSMKTSAFISKIQLIPSGKSCPNHLCIFAKLLIVLASSKMKDFRWAWLLGFRWNKFPKRGYTFSLSGANWLKANLRIMMCLLTFNEIVFIKI